MYPHTALPEAQVLQQPLGTSDLRQLFHLDRHPERDPRGEARGRRLVPRGDAQLTRCLAHIRLRHRHLDERVTHPVLGRGRQSRPEVAEVVHVRARHHDREVVLLGDAREHVVQLGLAVVAAIGAVREVRRPFGLVRAHGSMDDAQRVGDAPSLIGLARGQRRRDGRDRERTITEGTGRDGGHERGVDAAGVGDDHAARRRKDLVEPVELARHLGGRHRGDCPTGEQPETAPDVRTARMGVRAVPSERGAPPIGSFDLSGGFIASCGEDVTVSPRIRRGGRSISRLAARTLRLDPVTACRNTSRSSASSRQSVTAVTVAVRGTSRSNAISPNVDPGPSRRLCSPAIVTATVPSDTT